MRRRLQFWRVSLCSIVWAFIAIIIVLFVTLYAGGDRWWLATLIMFGPRWMLVIPLSALILLAVVYDRSLLLPLAVASLLVLGPFMGLQIPIHSTDKSDNNRIVRIVSCNVQNGDFNEQALRYQIEQARADIVALQECPRGLRQVVPAEWYRLREGDLAVYSRYPLMPGPILSTVQPPHTWPRMNLLTCTVTVNGRTLSFGTVHLPSPRYGIHHLLDRRTVINVGKSDYMIKETDYRRDVSARAGRIVATLPGPVVIAGDFNLPVESSIYRQDWGGYRNAFSAAGFGYGLTEWVVLKGIAFGVRIDHLLLSDGVPIVKCHVGADVGSDHLPLIAEIVL